MHLLVLLDAQQVHFQFALSRLQLCLGSLNLFLRLFGLELCLANLEAPVLCSPLVTRNREADLRGEIRHHRVSARSACGRVHDVADLDSSVSHGKWRAHLWNRISDAAGGLQSSGEDI